MTIFLILVFLFLFTFFAIATGIFVIAIRDGELLKTILAYLLFLAVLAIPTFGFGWVVWQRLVGS